MNYYDEILQEIENDLKQGKIDDADFLIRREQAAPYIPIDVEKKLKQFHADAVYLRSEKEEQKEESLEYLLAGLHGDAAKQLASSSALCERNLRECIPEIREWLSGNPQTEAAAMMLEGIAEQQIQELFQYKRDGLQYAFYGDSLIPVTKSRGFQKALVYLKDWFARNPSLFEMARTLLIHKAYLYLPLSYEEQEALPVALETADEVCDLMGENRIREEIHAKIRQDD